MRYPYKSSKKNLKKFSPSALFLLLAFSALPPTDCSASYSYVWLPTTGGAWNVTSNWESVPSGGTFPQITADIAVFHLPGVSASATISLDQNITIGELFIQSGSPSISYTIAPGGAFTLNFTNSSGSGVIGIENGAVSETHFITCNIQNTSGMSVNSTSSGSALATLNISGTVLSPAPANNLEMLGPGTLNLTGTGSNFLTLTATGGLVQLNKTSSATAVSGGASVGNGASVICLGPNQIQGGVGTLSGGTFAFGAFVDSPGTITNSGAMSAGATISPTSFTQNAGATLTLDVSNTSPFTYGNISSSGAVSLAGGSLVVTNSGSYTPPGGSSLILMQGTSLTGTLSYTPTAFLGSTISYLTDQVLLTFAATGCNNGTWTGDTSTYWGDTYPPTNWAPGCFAPGTDISSPNNTATFNNAGSSPIAVELADNSGAAEGVTLQALNFGATTTAYTLQQAVGGGGTITLDGTPTPTITVTTLSAVNPTIDVPVILGADSILSVASGSTLTFGGAGVISGAFSLTNSGAGTVILGGPSTYLGATLISTGTLQAGVATSGSTGAFGNGSAVTMSGGTLELETFNNTIGSLSGTAGSINLGSATLTIANGSSNTFSGIISDTSSGGLTLTTGTLTLDGLNTYTGATTINGGTLTTTIPSSVSAGPFGNGSTVTIASGGTLALAGNNNTIGSLSGDGSVTLGGATLTLANGSSAEFDGVISGSGTVILNSGTFTLGGVNTYSTGTTVNNTAILALTGSGALASSLTLDNSSTFDITQVTTSATIGDLTSAVGTTTIGLGAKKLIVTTSNATIDTFAGTIKDAGIVVATGGALTASGAGTLILSGTNTYTGATTVTTGAALQAGSTTAFGTASDVTVDNGGTLAFETFQNTVGSLNNSGLLSTSAKVDASSFTQTGNLVLNVTASPPSQGYINTTGALNLGGILSAQNSGYTPVVGTSIVLLQGTSLGGTFSSTSATGFGSTSITNVGDQVLLNFLSASCSDGFWVSTAATGNWQNSDPSSNWAGTCPAPGIAPSENDTATFGDVGGPSTVAITLANTGGTSSIDVTLQGLTFDASSTTYTIQQFSGSGSITLDGTSAPTINVSTASGANPIINVPIILDANSIFSVGSSSILTLGSAGVISGTSSIANNGDGVVILQGPSTYTGATLINAGTMQAGIATSGSTGAFGNGSAVTISGGTLDLESFNNTIGSLSGGSGSVTLGSATLTIANGSGNTFSGIISDTSSGGLTLTTGTLTLSALNSYTGATTINGGTLTAGIPTSGGLGPFGSGSLVTIASGGTLALAGNNNTIGSLSAAGPTTASVTLGGATLTIANGGINEFDGIISGTPGSALVLNSGFFTLGGVNSYPGGTTLHNASYLALKGSGALSSAGSLALDKTSSFDISQVTTSATIGDLISPIASSAVNLGGKMLTVGTSNSTDYYGTINDGGIIAGTGGSFVKQGSGTLTLHSTTGTYSGGTTILDGTLSISSDSNLGASGTAITFGSPGGALEITSNISSSSRPIHLTDPGTITVDTSVTASFSGIINGTSLTKNGDGTLTLTGANTYTLGTTIEAGTLALSGTGILFSTGALQLTNTGSVFTGSTFDISSITATSTSIGDLNGATGTTINLGNKNLIITTTATTDTFEGTVNDGGIGSGTSGSLTTSGAGTLILSGSNTYTGATTVTTGATLKAGSTSAFGTGSDVTVDSGGTLAFVNNANTVGTINNAGTLSSGATVTATSYTQTAGTLTLDVSSSDASTYGNIFTGAVSLAGILNVTNSGSYTPAGGSTLVLIQGTSSIGGTLSYTPTAFPGSSISYPTGQVLLTFPAIGCDHGTWTSTSSGNWQSSLATNWESGCFAPGTDISSPNNTATFNDVTPPSAIIVTMADTAGSAPQSVTLQALTFDAPSTTYTLQQYSGAGTITLAGTPTPTINVSASTLTPTINVPIILGANSTLSVASGSTLTLGSAGVISGAFSLTNSGAGTVILDGPSTYSGATLINAGTLQAGVATVTGVSGAFGNGSAVTIANGGTLDLHGFNNTIESLSGSGATTAAVTLGSGTLTISNGNSLEFDGIISGSTGGALVLSGGTFTLGGVNTYPGGTTINSTGTLIVSSDSNLGNTSGGITFNGGTLEISTTGFSSARTLTFTGTGIFDVTAASATFSGTSTGAGGLTKDDSGILTLTGANDYSGNTTINAGTLAIGGSLNSSTDLTLNNSGSVFDISLSSGVAIGDLVSGDSGTMISLGGQNLTITTSVNTDSYAGTIQDTSVISPIATGGSLTVAGTGKLTLTAGNSYTGGTTISGGTLALSGAGALDLTGSVDLTGSSAVFDISLVTLGTTDIGNLSGTAGSIQLGNNNLTVSASGTPAAFAGVIKDTGSGTLSVLNTGTLTLSGINTYAGLTSVGGSATLAISLGGDISSSSGVSLSGTSTFDISGATGGVSIGDLNAIAGTFVTLGSNALTVTTTGADLFAGKMTGDTTSGILNVNGSGQLTIDAASTLSDYAATNVNATFIVNGTITNPVGVTVNSGGVLGGSGTITGPTIINSGASLSPGNSIGTINLVGSLLQHTGSNLDIELNPTSADLVNITGGTMTIVSGATLNLNFDLGSYTTGMTYTIVQTPAHGDISGEFSTVNNSAPLLNPVVSYPLTESIVVTLGPFTPVVVVVNQGNPGAVASCVDATSATPGSDIATIIAALLPLSTPELYNAFNQMQPSAFKGLAVSQQNIFLEVENVLTHRYLSFFPTACEETKPTNKKPSVWLDTFVANQTQGEKTVAPHSPQPAYTTSTFAILAGIDTNVSKNFSIGACTGYSRGIYSMHSDAGTGDVDSFYVGPYLKFGHENNEVSPYLTASLLGQANWYDTNRHINFSDISRTAHGSHTGQGLLLHTGGGVWLKAGKFDISPFVNCELIAMKENSYTESGADSLNLHVQSSFYQFGELEGGVMVRNCIHVSHGMIVPEISLSILREKRFKGNDYKASLAGTDGCEFTVEGYYPNRTLFLPAAEVKAFLLDDRFTASLYYQGKFGDDFSENELGLQFAWNF